MSQPAQSCAGPAENLAELLHPVDAADFLANEYGRTFRHVAGTPGKFTALLPWPALNRILEEHRLEPPRLRLTREGKPIPPERYLSYASNRRRSGRPIPRLNSAAFTHELRDGATLVLDAVDELHRPVRRLAESLERVFRVRVQVNGYAGWRTSHGFDLHWDDHDVFVLQIAGRKQWKVYGMTRPYPLAKDVASGSPPSEVLWEGMLEDGDLLYIPRGWWHVATPLDEPTLHLTVGVNNPTGADFLAWFANRMKKAEIVRSDIPHLHGTAALREYLETLRKAVAEELRPEDLDAYLEELDSNARPRPSFALPGTASPDVLAARDVRLRWNGQRAIRIAEKGGELTIAAHGRKWRFAAAARPLLELLASGRVCEIADIEDASPALPPDTVRAFVKELVASGLVVIV